MINQSKIQPRCTPTAPDNSELFFGLDTLSFFHVEPTVASDSGDIAKRPNVRCRTGGWSEDPADEEWAISRNDRMCAAEPGAGAKTRLTLRRAALALGLACAKAWRLWAPATG